MICKINVDNDGILIAGVKLIGSYRFKDNELSQNMSSKMLSAWHPKNFDTTEEPTHKETYTKYKFMRTGGRELERVQKISFNNRVGSISFQKYYNDAIPTLDLSQLKGSVFFPLRINCFHSRLILPQKGLNRLLTLQDFFPYGLEFSEYASFQEIQGDSSMIQRREEIFKGNGVRRHKAEERICFLS